VPGRASISPAGIVEVYFILVDQRLPLQRLKLFTSGPPRQTPRQRIRFPFPVVVDGRAVHSDHGYAGDAYELPLRERNFIQEGASAFSFSCSRQTGEQAFSFGVIETPILPCADLASLRSGFPTIDNSVSRLFVGTGFHQSVRKWMTADLVLHVGHDPICFLCAKRCLPLAWSRRSRLDQNRRDQTQHEQ